MVSVGQVWSADITYLRLRSGRIRRWTIIHRRRGMRGVKETRDHASAGFNSNWFGAHGDQGVREAGPKALFLVDGAPRLPPAIQRQKVQRARRHGRASNTRKPMKAF